MSREIDEALRELTRVLELLPEKMVAPTLGSLVDKCFVDIVKAVPRGTLGEEEELKYIRSLFTIKVVVNAALNADYEGINLVEAMQISCKNIAHSTQEEPLTDAEH